MEIANTLELEIRNHEKVVAHTGCLFINGVVQIKDLFVMEKYRDRGFDEVLLSEVLEYAVKKSAKQIVMYCGPEPFCEDGQIPLEQEILWYESHGFVHDHDVFGVVPCMIKVLEQGGEIIETKELS